MAQQAIASGERVFEILDTKLEVTEKPDAIELTRFAGRVEFRDVSFAYGKNPPLLRDIGFTIEPGRTLALVGASGSGKSTLINLIPRFYDVTAGAVLADDHDVRDVQLKSLRSQVGMVMQETFLFNATIRENICYGREDATSEEMERAASAANAHEFIVEQPDGYDTLVGEHGVRLSGGQRQRLAIARALLVDPRILILDEATSSVDTQTDFMIQRALDDLMEGRTTIVIAHRLSTVQRADMILVLEDGRIVSRGDPSRATRNQPALPTYPRLAVPSPIRWGRDRERRPTGPGRGAVERRRGHQRAPRGPGREQRGGATMMMRGFGGGMGVGSVSGRRRTSMMEKPEFQTSPWQVAKRLAPIVAGFRRQIIIALVMVIAASSLQMLIPLSFKYTIDEVIPSGDLTMLWVIGGGLLVLEVLRYFLGYMQRVALAIAAQQLVFEMAKRLFEHVQRLSLRFYERQGTGEIISRATNDVGVLQQSISGGTVASAIRPIYHAGLRRADAPAPLATGAHRVCHGAAAFAGRTGIGQHAPLALPAGAGEDGRCEFGLGRGHLRCARQQGVRA